MVIFLLQQVYEKMGFGVRCNGLVARLSLSHLLCDISQVIQPL